MEKFRKYLSNSHSRLTDIQVNNDPSLIVVIPAFNESMILATLDSLRNAVAPMNVLVLIVVNYSESASINVKNFNLLLFNLLQHWCNVNSTRELLFRVVLEADMLRKHAGAGFARKTGMDTAVDIFQSNQRSDGVIASLDADCSVKRNYFETLKMHFSQYPDTNILLLDFHHDVTHASPSMRDAIVLYELYLNYYVLGCRLAGFPYAYHTIGSAFAVSADAYVREGGMNKKHAGEDFYFLHKMFPLQQIYRNYDTCVYPSPRVSSRVPFGTGPAMKNILEDGGELEVYNPNSFFQLQNFFLKMGELYENPEKIDELICPGLKLYFKTKGFGQKIEEARSNSASRLKFVRRLLQHFDAFQMVKYLNFAHEKGYYTKIPVEKAVQGLLFKTQPYTNDKYKLLQQMREREKTIPLRQLK